MAQRITKLSRILFLTPNIVFFNDISLELEGGIEFLEKLIFYQSISPVQIHFLIFTPVLVLVWF